MPNLWIALIGVGQLPGSSALGKAEGAYVKAVATAVGPREYEEAIRAAAEELGLFVFELEDVSEIGGAGCPFTDDNEAARLSEEAKRLGGVRFGTFHAYTNTDS